MSSPTVVASAACPATAPPDPAEAARTLVAAATTARLLVPGRPASTVGYLDDDGQPVLVLAPGAGRRLDGPGVLLIRAGSDLVRLGGRLQERPPGRADVGAAVDGGTTSAVPSGGPVRLVRLEVEQVLLGAPEPRQVTVSVVGYAEAAPDLFAAHGRLVADHLQHEHPDLLAALVRGTGPDRGEVIAIGVRCVDGAGLQLDVVTPLGATRLRAELPIADPWDACHALAQLVRGTAGMG